MFAMEHYSVEPDVICVAKSLAGGFPLSGVIGRAEIMDAADPGGLGGTYAGNPVACAAALAVLDIFQEEKLLDRSKAIGERVKARLKALKPPTQACPSPGFAGSAQWLLLISSRKEDQTLQTPNQPSAWSSAPAILASLSSPAASMPTPSGSSLL